MLTPFLLLPPHTQPGDVVVDMTAGSLVTAIACLRMARYCICAEKDTESQLLPKAQDRLRLVTNHRARGAWGV